MLYLRTYFDNGMKVIGRSLSSGSCQSSSLCQWHLNKDYKVLDVNPTPQIARVPYCLPSSWPLPISILGVSSSFLRFSSIFPWGDPSFSSPAVFTWGRFLVALGASCYKRDPAISICDFWLSITLVVWFSLPARCRISCSHCRWRPGDKSLASEGLKESGFWLRLGLGHHPSVVLRFGLKIQ